MNFSSVARDLVLMLSQGPMRRSHAVKLTSQDLVSRLEGIGAVVRCGSPWMLRLGETPIPMQPKASLPIESRQRERPLLTRVEDTLGDSEMTGAQIAAQLGYDHECISSSLLRYCSQGHLIRRRQHGTIDGKTHKREFYLYRRA